MAGNDELACTYAALILTDDDVPVTSEKLATILKAANVEVEREIFFEICKPAEI